MSVTKRTRWKKGKKITVYDAEVYARGIRIATKSFDTAAAAYIWHDKEKERILQGESRVDESFTLEECIKRYREEAFSRQQLSSQQTKEPRLHYMEAAPMRRCPMRQLNSMVVDEWIRWLLKHPSAKNPGRKSFEHELRILTVVLNWYRNYVDANYVVPVTKRHREMVCYKQTQRRRPDYFARPEEVQRWIAWLAEHRNPVYSRLAKFLVLTGARVSEATGLLWDAVDFDESLARVVRRVRWDHSTRKPTLEETTKTDGSARILILPDTLVTMLKAIKEESQGVGPVFANHHGELLKYNAIQSAFNAGFVALNLPWRSTHICRHTYATLALQATGDLGSVQASLGHTNSRMTERYAKVVALLSSRTANKTAALLDLPENHV